MKKFFLFLLLSLILTSCNLQMLDNEGFTIYQFGWSLTDNQILIQSHDGFIIDDNIYNEIILDNFKILNNQEIYRNKIIVKNKLSHSILLKITTDHNSIYKTLEAKENVIYIYQNSRWKLKE